LGDLYIMVEKNDALTKTIIALVISVIVYSVIIKPAWLWIKEHLFIFSFMILIIIFIAISVIKSFSDTSKKKKTDELETSLKDSKLNINVNQYKTTQFNRKLNRLHTANTFHETTQTSRNHEKRISKIKSDLTSFEVVLNQIKKYNPPEYIRDEKEFENGLLSFLYGRPEIENKIEILPQVKMNNRKPDFVIDGKYAIEIKLIESIDILRKLKSQVEEYSDIYEKTGAVLVYDGYNLSEIQNYVKRIENIGIKTILIKTKIRRKKHVTRLVIDKHR